VSQTQAVRQQTQPLDLASLPREAAVAWVARAHPPEAVAALLGLNPARAQDVVDALPPAVRGALDAAAGNEQASQWARNGACAAGTVGRLMEPVRARLSPDMTLGDAVEQLRGIVAVHFVTYGYVVDADGRLVGVVTMRDLLFGDRARPLREAMIAQPFFLTPELSFNESMRRTANRHYPVYPVCDAGGTVIGQVRGAALFEVEAFEITAQPGAMVGVEREERIATPMTRAFRFRHPWLQLNLLTAFAAGAVVAMFQGTVDQLVILATFLPVLAGQSGNTGCQALAVTVRGLTLGDVRAGSAKTLVSKEFFLGLANGGVTGLLCAAAMYWLATAQASAHALALALAVFLAMTLSCAVSGVSGALVPLALKRLGAGPAPASSIIVTTATDVASMGLLLGLATLLVL
jgi:magnesium transporter